MPFTGCLFRKPLQAG